MLLSLKHQPRIFFCCLFSNGSKTLLLHSIIFSLICLPQIYRSYFQKKQVILKLYHALYHIKLCFVPCNSEMLARMPLHYHLEITHLAQLLLFWLRLSLLFISSHHQSLLCRFIFTADPRGILKLWRLSDPLPSGSLPYGRTFDVSLIAEFTSCFGIRIMCLDASFENEVSSLSLSCFHS